MAHPPRTESYDSRKRAEEPTLPPRPDSPPPSYDPNVEAAQPTLVRPAAIAPPKQYDPETDAQEPTILPPPEAATPGALIDTEMVVGGGQDTDPGIGANPRGPRKLGEYELLGELGRGGMGIVFRARQTTADRIVALKIIRPDQLTFYDPAMQEQVIRRFQTESRAAARLNHDHLVTVYDVGQVDGYHYYSMQFVPGESLADRIVKAPLSGKETARLLEQVAAGIHHAHAHDVLHRDLKPQNILIDAETDRAMVADFGLAKLLDSDAEQQTATKGIIGTVAFMAPEQTRPPIQTTPATDIWALGAIIYCCVTGRPPFQAKDYVATFKQIQEADPASPRVVNPDVDRDIETICLKCLEKLPEKRYRTANEVAEELGRYRRGEPILARPPGLAERTWRWTKKHKGLAASAATILVLVAGAIWAAAAARADARAEGYFNNLFNAEPRELLGLIHSLQDDLPRIEPALRDLLPSNGAPQDPTSARGGNSQQIRAAMALLPSDPQQRDFLARAVLDCDSSLVLPLVDLLHRHGPELKSAFWADMPDASVAPRPRGSDKWFRRAAALANWDPEGRPWRSPVASLVAEELIAQDSFLVAGVWLDAFRPVADILLDDLLRHYDQSDDPEHRATAAQIISDWYAADATALTRFAVLADADHYARIAPLLLADDHRQTASRLLEGYLNPRPIFPYVLNRSQHAARETPDEIVQARRRANAIAVWCHLNGPDDVWRTLKQIEKPHVRGILIHRLQPDMLAAVAVIGRLRQEQDASIRRALILILGEWPRDGIPAEFPAELLAIYQNDADSGVHAAAAWALRQWNHEVELAAVEKRLRDNGPPGREGERNWYVNRNGHTMVVLRGGAFLMGSPEGEVGRTTFPTATGRGSYETPQLRRIGRTFSISNTETTVEQYRRFRKDHNYDDQWALHLDCPVGRTTWRDAADYCNWLSEQEGLPESEWCYPTDWDQPVFPEDYLSRRGYRLPTEAEWEFACRAGTVTSRYYGAADELLVFYAWHNRNAKVSQPVGWLKPNDFGLFDMYGNAFEWCDNLVGDPAPHSAAGVNDVSERDLFGERVLGVVRSETVEDEPDHMRSAMRNWAAWNGEVSASGFRVARTEAVD